MPKSPQDAPGRTKRSKTGEGTGMTQNTGISKMSESEEITRLRSSLAAAVEERDRATLSEDALQEKVDTMADAMNELGLTCGCSVDRPGDLCMHHSPRLLAAVKRAEAAERERDAARCDVAHAQFDRDAALNLVESAESRAQSEIEMRKGADNQVRLVAAEAAEATMLLQEYCDECPARACGQMKENCPKCGVGNFFKSPGPSSAIVGATYPYMCRIGHAQIGHSTDGESCPVCIEKGAARLSIAEAAELRKAAGMMREELMRLHEIICEEDAQSIETLLKETDALMNAPCPSSAILAVVDAARAVADDYIAPSSLILALRKALCAIDGGSHV